MKYAVIVLAIAMFAISAASASSAGQFLPRAFFTLDAEGHQSDVHPVNAHLLRRLRRQVYSASSSSSSSSSSSGNGITFASTSHNIQNADGSGSAGSSYTQQAAPASLGSVNFESRFGEDSASGQYNPSYNTGAYNGNNGAYNGNGAYNTNPASYNTAAAVNTNTGYGSTSNYGQSYGTGAVPATQIHQTVTTFDANGNQKVTTVQGATDATGVLNVHKTEANYSG
nr:probable ATP-dependent RNA helicase ddx17 [Drosophila suzukii]XP_016928043.1 probable ATP-dependent RNA helicase ddx17 [Drosophila suzukii]